ncbi:MAG TPA: hypothetical protein VFA86_13985 [Gammaproteobacteria bacterium]|nr:hypothetical protein [Gammaproteobacteria bacterium]
MRYFLLGLALLAFGWVRPSAAAMAITGNYLSDDQYSGGYAIGLGVYGLRPHGLSYYGNSDFSTHDNKYQYDSLNPSSFGDAIIARKHDLVLVNFGVTYTLTPFTAFYGGVGFASEQGYDAKFDPTYTLSPDGTYYVNDNARDRSGGNANVGVLLFLEHFTLEFGYQSFMQKTYIGAGWRF